MTEIVLAVWLTVAIGGMRPPAAQAPRDPPAPAIENARRERELRSLIADGRATKETYLELASLLNRQQRSAEVIEAMRGAAALEPESAEAQHRLATLCWSYVNRSVDLDAPTRLKYIREGIAAEDRALAIDPDAREAMTYKNILLRLQANLSEDPAERARLIAEADDLRNRVIAMQKRADAGASLRSNTMTANVPAPPPPPFTGFDETFEAAAARLTPVRVGGNVRQPTKTRDVKPVYPAEAQNARVQGVVVIEAIVDPSGAIANARVLRSIPMLDQAALGAVSAWHFTPTELNGAAVSVIMTVTVNFSLQ
jgi:TonB family protein